MKHEMPMLPVDSGKLMDETIEMRRKMVRAIFNSCEDDFEFGELLDEVSAHLKDIVLSIGEVDGERYLKAEKILKAMGKEFKYGHR